MSTKAVSGSSSANPPYLFQPGQSGNPSGRSKLDPKVRALAKQYTEEAMLALYDALKATRLVVSGEDLHEHPDHPTRIHAANAILNRGWGTPAPENAVTQTDEGGQKPVHELTESQVTRMLQIAREGLP